MDMVVQFLTVPMTMREPTVAKTGKIYLKGWFFLDFVATVVSNALILFPGYSAGLWKIRLKLVRIFKRHYIAYSYNSIVRLLTQGKPMASRLIDFIITTLVECIFWQHILTCIWIKLGSLDAYQERYKDMDPSEVSWMCIVGSDFSADEDRNIYEQIIDKDYDYNEFAMYNYANYFVLTVVSTVGYGAHSYQTSGELLYVCFLEVVGTFIQAYLIAILATSLLIGQFKFKTLLHERIEQV